LRISRYNLSQGNNLDIYFTSNPASGPTVSPGSVIFQSTNQNGDFVFIGGGSTTTNGQNVIIDQDGNLLMGAGNASLTNGNLTLGQGRATLTNGDLAVGSFSGSLPGKISQKVTNTASAAVPFGIYSEVNSAYDWQTNLRLSVNRDNSKAISILHSGMGDESFVVLGDGTTWIGNEVPTGNFSNALLSVAGMMTAKEIYVQSTHWADYVFEDDYALRSLDEVASFIDQHGHLPNVPSAADIAKNGQNLADTDRILLEKVEELTLYLIELKQEIERLDGENEALRNMLPAAK
jgi:hypothetical protein